MSVKANWTNGEQFTAADANAVAEGVNNAYVKPGTGIPKTDLASAVQTSLGKADTAVQSVSSTSITDATTTGKSLITATDASAARTTLGVAYGTTSGTVCQGNDSRLSPSSASITDATTVGKALLTATDAATARTTLGVAYGTTSTTVAVGNDSRITGAEQTANKNAANGYVGADSSGKLALSSITSSTTTALGVGSIELGHASDTTITRSAAGKIAVEGVDVVTTSASQTLSSKTLTNPVIDTVNTAAGAAMVSFNGGAGTINLAVEGFKHGIYSNTSATDGGWHAMYSARSGSTGSLFGFYYGTSGLSLVGNITTNGSSTTYGTTSDYRLKLNPQTMTGGLTRINALRPVTFQWELDDSDGEGFIAHELQEVIPLAVDGEKDAVNEDGSILPQNVDYSKVVPHLVAAVQELSAKLEAAEARIAALEAQ